MNISGLQKMTLLDYPGKVACTVFLSGCNFRCPYCHNSELLDGKIQPLMTQEEFLSFLSKRKGLLDGVCITGGEPLLQSDLKEFLLKLKEIGYAYDLSFETFMQARKALWFDESLVLPWLTVMAKTAAAFRKHIQQ